MYGCFPCYCSLQYYECHHLEGYHYRSFVLKDIQWQHNQGVSYSDKKSPLGDNDRLCADELGVSINVSRLHVFFVRRSIRVFRSADLLVVTIGLIACILFTRALALLGHSLLESFLLIINKTASILFATLQWPIRRINV